MAQIFSNIGWHSSVIDGGYKSYRRHVLDCLDHLPKQLSLVIVIGPNRHGENTYFAGGICKRSACN